MTQFTEHLRSWIEPEPLEAHTRRLVRWIVVLLLLAWLLSSLGRALQLPGKVGDGYPPSTLRFQVSEQADEREAILRFWRKSPGMKFIANTVVAIDALAFVPSYTLVLLLAIGWLRRRSIGLRPSPAESGVTLRLGKLATGAVAGTALFDQVENLLSLCVINTGQVPAPGTWHLALEFFATVKWLAALVVCLVLFCLGLRLVRAVGRKSVSSAAWVAAKLAVNAVESAFLYFFPLLALVAGIVLVGFVPQTREILTSLGLEPGDDQAANLMRQSNLLWLGFGVLLWAFSIWYSMRIVAAWTPGYASADNRHSRLVAREAPRLVAYFGVVAVATLSALSMSARASLAMAFFMGLGAIILHEAMFSLLGALTGAQSKLLFVGGHRPDAASYRRAAWVIAFLAVMMAWGAVGTDPTPVLGEFGWYRKPDMAWRWHAGNISTQTLTLVALFAGAALAYGLVVAFRRGPRWHIAMNAVAVGCWVGGAWLADASLAVLVFGLVMVFGVLALWFVAERRHFNWAFLKQIYEAVQHTLPPDQRILLENRQVTFWAVLLVLSLGTVVLFSIDPLQWGWSMGTLGIVFAALALWSFVATLCWVYLPKRKGLGNWALVPAVWLVFFGQQADHTMRVRPVAPSTVVNQPTIHTHFARWRTGLPDADHSPVFFVAASGGGLRAAYWTALLLAAMDDRTCGRFGAHVFAVSGVSGGSVGLTAYLAQRRTWEAKSPQEKCQPGRVEQMQRFLRRDFLGPVAGSLLFAEAVQAFVPFTYLQQERGRTLADSIAYGWKSSFPGEPENLLETPFLDLFGLDHPQDDTRYRMPAVYLNATGVESGRRVIASNLFLGSISADPLFFDGATRLQTAGLSAIDATINSARFPGISPPGRVLACAQGLARSEAGARLCEGHGHGTWGHVFDGGFFENSGLETAMDALHELSGNEANRSTKKLPPVFVISITNDVRARPTCPGRTPRIDMVGKDKSAWGSINAVNSLVRRATAEPSGAAGEKANGSDLMAPLKTLLSVREARADLQLRRAVEELGCAQIIEWSLSEVMQSRNEPALGWLLSKRSVGEMDRGASLYAEHFPFDSAWCWKNGVRSRGVLGRNDAPAGVACPAIAQAQQPLRPGSRP
jgi:hypothetical protein